MLTLSTLPLLLLGAQLAQAQKPTVAVMYFNNSSLVSHDDYEPLRGGLADILITELQSNSRITVVERDALHKILEEQNLVGEKRVDPETAARVGKILGARHIIVGGFLIDTKGTLRVDARAVNVETSAVEYTDKVTGKADALLDIIGELAQKLNTGLQLPAPPTRRSSSDRGAEPASGSWKKTLLTYMRALSEDDAHNKNAAVALYRQFLAESPATYAIEQRKRAESRLKELTDG